MRSAPRGVVVRAAVGDQGLGLWVRLALGDWAAEADREQPGRKRADPGCDLAAELLDLGRQLVAMGRQRPREAGDEAVETLECGSEPLERARLL